LEAVTKMGMPSSTEYDAVHVAQTRRSRAL